MIARKRTRCISCGTDLPPDIVMIGDQYPSAIFLGKNSPAPPGLAASSLNVTRCPNESCTLVQLAHEYDLQYVFDHYPYESASTATMKQLLQDVAADACDVVALGAGDAILDIGGNDGTLLDLIETPVRARVNIDAAAGVTQIVSAPDYHHVHARFSAVEYRALDLPKPKLITSVAMFYHLNDPVEFCRQVAEIMDDTTVWVIQMTYLGTMLRDNIFDNIVHEHVAYYSLFSVEALLRSVGLHVAEARLVPSYGGSLRLFVVKRPESFPPRRYRHEYEKLRRFEQENRTNKFEALYAFDSRTQLLRSSLRELVSHIAKQHGPLWGFGASTKGNMILQFLGIDSATLPQILDNSPKKIGSTTTGSLIPIVDESFNISRLPSYLLVLPYYYTDAFVKIIGRRLEAGKRVHLLVPLPYPRFVTVGA